MEINTLYNGIIVDSAAVLRPTIRIAPLTNDYLCEKYDVDIQKALNYLSNRFGQYKICIKGKQAISEVLSTYNLQRNDLVTVLTTSENYYISGCVTREIEKFCGWNRHICAKTKVIFFNHEFGFPRRDMESIAQYGLPIIEDCAHSFFDVDEQIGRYSDFVIYSLPKAFSMQVGAVVKTNKDLPYEIDDELKMNILRHLSHNLDNIEWIKDKRKENCRFLLSNLSDVGIESYFNDKTAIPGVLLFRWYRDINYQNLKDFMQSNGVECSVFYGEPAFYIPCHQNLSINELNYMINLIKYWCKNNI
jgi:dTDP-4-amino-4,6-dideoxygalactose transaminase